MRQLETQEQAGLEQEGAKAPLVYVHGFALRDRPLRSAFEQGSDERSCCPAAPEARTCRLLGGILRREENDDNGFNLFSHQDFQEQQHSRS